MLPGSHCVMGTRYTHEAILGNCTFAAGNRSGRDRFHPFFNVAKTGGACVTTGCCASAQGPKNTSTEIEKALADLTVIRMHDLLRDAT
ncbi:MAG: hypothetical protein DWH96_12115 [Planctomycetota bacterium]|nr:MAG: hypothetical protein DWH96_12115 [Planctomycetota bacterium]RLS92223.1 MAG: hypothetical protein DWI11_09525 [Planctomycetota bacterium]